MTMRFLPRLFYHRANRTVVDDLTNNQFKCKLLTQIAINEEA